MTYTQGQWPRVLRSVRFMAAPYQPVLGAADGDLPPPWRGPPSLADRGAHRRGASGKTHPIWSVGMVGNFRASIL